MKKIELIKLLTHLQVANHSSVFDKDLRTKTEGELKQLYEYAINSTMVHLSLLIEGAAKLKDQKTLDYLQASISEKIREAS